MNSVSTSRSDSTRSLHRLERGGVHVLADAAVHQGDPIDFVVATWERCAVVAAVTSTSLGRARVRES